MSSISSIALTGMNAAQTQLGAAASNVANVQTEGYQRRTVQQSPQDGGGVTARVTAAPQPGPALESDLVSQLQAKNAFLANLAVFKSSDAMAGALFKHKA